MGIAGARKVTYVTSVVYNMAGPEIGRIDFLKTVVAGAIISNRDFSMADCLVGSYLSGPGIKVRSVHRWARNPANYGGIGIPTVKFTGTSAYDTNVIKAQIPPAVDETYSVTSVHFAYTDYSFWADQWILINQPNKYQTAYTAKHDPVTDLITITWPDATTNSFAPVGMVFDEQYFYVTYTRKNSTTMLEPRLWIYRIGSGNATMDALATSDNGIGEFLPFIPIRHKNQFLSATYQAEAFAQAKKAYRKATGQSFASVVDKIAANPNIGDIDYSYMVYGTVLNCKDQAARKYLFKFFDFLRTAQRYDPNFYATYRGLIEQHRQQSNDYRVNRQTYLTVSGEDPAFVPGTTSDPGYTNPPPVQPAIPVTSLKIKSSGTFDTKLNITMKWRTINKITGTGLAKVGAKLDEVWFEVKPPFAGASSTVNFLNRAYEANDIDDNVLHMFHQKSLTEYDRIEIIGLLHQNIIHNGEMVEITANEAMVDLEESGFIVPLHYETLRSMSLIESTQMMTAATYLVMNCYKVVKQPWYTTTIFKIFVFVVLIAITVATAGAAAPGLLGAAGAVGASLGFVGLMATIAGAVLNALAAMILIQLISVVSIELLGEKIGTIVAAIASVAAIAFGGGALNGQSLAQSWGSLMTAQGLIQITNAVGKGIAGYMNAVTADTIAKTTELATDYAKQSKALTDAMIAEFGMGKFGYDPTLLTDASGALGESLDTFLGRTLMTGTDIAQMTHDMLNNMSNYTLTLKR